MVQETIGLINAVLPHTRFNAGRSGMLSLESLRTLYQHDILSGNMTAASSRAVIPSHLLEGLVGQIRPLLKDYTGPGGEWVGNGLAHLMGGARGITLTELAHVVVRAAAILGAERAVQILFGWIDGEPLRYRTRVLLSGAIVDDGVELGEGIEIARLPTSTDELRAHLPAYSTMFHGHHDFLAQV